MSTSAPPGFRVYDEDNPILGCRFCGSSDIEVRLDVIACAGCGRPMWFKKSERMKQGLTKFRLPSGARA